MRLFQTNPMSDLGMLKVLPPLELETILSLPDSQKGRYFVAAYADFDNKQVVLCRGDGTNIMVSFVLFEPNATAIPDFTDISIGDYGQTVRLGSYEASARSILLAVDWQFRAECESNKNVDIN